MKKIISAIIIICIIIIGFIAYKSMAKPTVKANAATLMNNSNSSNTQKTDTSTDDTSASSTSTANNAGNTSSSNSNTTTNTQSQSSNAENGQSNASNNQNSANTTKVSKNTGFIILSSTPFNKFAVYNGPHTWIYNLKNNKLRFSGSGCGKGMPLYISDKILAENNGVQETWYKVNFQVGMQSSATGYIQNNNLPSNLTDVSTVNSNPNLNLKTGVSYDDLQLVNQMQKKATRTTKEISGEWHPTKIVGHQPISTGKTLNAMSDLIISPTCITFNGTTVNNPNYFINSLTAPEFFNEYNCSLSKIDPNTNSIIKVTALKSSADILIKSSTELIINSGGVFFEYQK